MDKIKNLIGGKKTYLSAIALGVVVCLHSLGVLDDSQAQTLYVLLGAGGLAALRNAIPKG